MQAGNAFNMKENSECCAARPHHSGTWPSLACTRLKLLISSMGTHSNPTTAQPTVQNLARSSQFAAFRLIHEVSGAHATSHICLKRMLNHAPSDRDEVTRNGVAPLEENGVACSENLVATMFPAMLPTDPKTLSREKTRPCWEAGTASVVRCW